MGDHPSPQQEINNVPCEILVNLDDFKVPDLPKTKKTIDKDKDKDSPLDNSIGFEKITNLSATSDLFYTGRPSLLFDDGRESLGILPQFKLPLGTRHFELERADSCLVATSRQFDPFINIGRPSLLYDGRESLGILPQSKLNFARGDETIAELECWLQGSGADPVVKEEVVNKEDEGDNILQQFKKDCEAIENGEFIPEGTADITDENYSVYVEANFLASKIADNSILDISQEGGSILERTPQPDFVEDGDSLNQSDKKVDTESVYRQVDLMLPPTSTPSTDQNQNRPVETPSSSAKEINSRADLIKYLGNAVKQLNGHAQVCEILQSAMKQIADLTDSTQDASNDQQPHLSSVDEEDSGHSSTENEKELRDGNGALDLSIKGHHSDNTQALDLSFSKETVPRRLSITFSHKDDAALPEKQPSNKLKQQTAHMRQLWGSVNVTQTTASSNGSVASNDSKASSTCSMRVKLKPKKPEQDPKRGPLKAVVPLASLNTSLASERGLGAQPMGKPTTPTSKFAPMARSTPEDAARTDKRRTTLIGSPLARPGRTSRILQRSKLNTSPNVAAPPAPGHEKSLTRGKSSTDLKADAAKNNRPSLRRCYSVGGKENLSLQQSHKQGGASAGAGAGMRSFSKLPQKPLGVKSHIK